jgi:hypothetical protein
MLDKYRKKKSNTRVADNPASASMKFASALQDRSSQAFCRDVQLIQAEKYPRIPNKQEPPRTTLFIYHTIKV